MSVFSSDKKEVMLLQVLSQFVYDTEKRTFLFNGVFFLLPWTFTLYIIFLYISFIFNCNENYFNFGSCLICLDICSLNLIVAYLNFK